jgi:hypothetical protein
MICRSAFAGLIRSRLAEDHFVGHPLAGWQFVADNTGAVPNLDAALERNVSNSTRTGMMEHSILVQPAYFRGT